MWIEGSVFKKNTYTKFCQFHTYFSHIVCELLLSLFVSTAVYKQRFEKLKDVTDLQEKCRKLREQLEMWVVKLTDDTTVYNEFSNSNLVLLFCTFLIAAFSDLALCSKKFYVLSKSLVLSFIISQSHYWICREDKVSIDCCHGDHTALLLSHLCKVADLLLLATGSASLLVWAGLMSSACGQAKYWKI